MWDGISVGCYAENIELTLQARSTGNALCTCGVHAMYTPSYSNIPCPDVSVSVDEGVSGASWELVILWAES